MTITHTAICDRCHKKMPARSQEDLSWIAPIGWAAMVSMVGSGALESRFLLCSDCYTRALEPPAEGA